MKTTCHECNGKGKVEVPNYREMPSSEQPKPQKPKREVLKATKEWFRKWFYIFPVVGISLFPIFCIRFICWENSDAQVRQRDYDNNKNGTLMVEYDWLSLQDRRYNEKPIKCVVQHGETYKTNKPSRTIEIDDRHNDKLITEEAKLLGWDNEGDPCFRFHYSFDDK